MLFQKARWHTVKRLALYLPERDRIGNRVNDIEQWVDQAIILLCNLNGGATRLPPAEGVWLVEATGETIRETVHAVYSLVKPQAYLMQRAFIYDFLEKFGKGANQDTVAMEFDGRMYFHKIEHPALRKHA